jgi:hypothetical protein
MNLQNKTRLQIEQWTEKYGNLPYEIQSRIDNLVNQYEKRTYRINSVNTNGATIVREYQGKIFTVEILAKGFFIIIRFIEVCLQLLTKLPEHIVTVKGSLEYRNGKETNPLCHLYKKINRRRT